MVPVRAIEENGEEVLVALGRAAGVRGVLQDRPLRVATIG
jgi:hypothetical protein